jgi:tagatose-6-phosphate ketose/aldose isomerase
MLEMTASRASTMCESYLGLRHGPMRYVQQDILVMCFLSSPPTLLANETDLLLELDKKGLGLLKVFIAKDSNRTAPGP